MAKKKAIKKTKTKPRKTVRGLSSRLSKKERDILKELESVSDIESEELAAEFDNLLEIELEKELFKPAPKEKRIKAAPITYDKAGMRKLRNAVRKKDGTFFSARYYKSLLKKVGGKSGDDFDEALIALRNKNKNVRYYVDAKSFILYFQVGNFVDRLAGRKTTDSVSKPFMYNGEKIKGRKDKGNFTRKGAVVFTGEMKRGSSISVTDFYGDEIESTSVIQANDVVRKQTAIVDKVISILSPSEEPKKKGLTKKPKRKGSGIYVLIEETLTSNSEKEIVKISYNYANYEVQGIEKYIFAQVLDEVLHS